jgi:hypothetical protein
MNYNGWRPIEGCPQYRVSRSGRIVNMLWNKGKRPKEVTGFVGNRGYKTTLIGTKRLCFHRIVVEHFIGKIPKGMHVNHKDGNKQNNAVANLEIVTPTENARHSVVIGLTACGSKSVSAKLDEQKVRYIRETYGSGNATFQGLADHFGVTISLIFNIVRRTRWKHVA